MRWWRNDDRDLFGHRVSELVRDRDESDDIAASLRLLSETALHAGLGRSSIIIEVAAIMVELEGSVVYRGAAER